MYVICYEATFMANRHAQLAVVSAALLESAGERTAPGERSRFVGARSGSPPWSARREAYTRLMYQLACPCQIPPFLFEPLVSWSWLGRVRDGRWGRVPGTSRI